MLPMLPERVSIGNPFMEGGGRREFGDNEHKNYYQTQPARDKLVPSHRRFATFATRQLFGLDVSE
jgi:hypothetical protein